MPDPREPQVLETVSPDVEPFKLGSAPITDAYALALVLGDFQNAQQYRQPHEQRWSDADLLYSASVPNRKWKGSDVDRSALGIPLVATHIDTIHPQMMAAILSLNAYQYLPAAGSTVEDANMIEDWMRGVLLESGFEEELDLSLHQFLRYGNGGLEWYFDPVRNELRVRFCDLRDFYFDPANPSPNIQKCRYVIRRSRMTLEELDDYRGKGFTIPQREVLLALTQGAQSATVDTNFSHQHALQGASFDPQREASATMAPTLRGIEVLCYYTKKRYIWILDRRVVIYNGENPYGLYPFMFAPCYLEAGTPYARGVADRVGNFQLYLQGLFNLNLDGKHIQLLKPMAFQKEAGKPGDIGALFPGQTFKLSQNDGLTPIEVGPDLANITMELQYAEVMSEKATGANSVSQGIPRPGNANRTLGGIQEQAQGATNRVSSLVRAYEVYVVEPLLNIGLQMARYHLDTSQDFVRLLSPDGESAMQTASILLKPGKFFGRAASKMMTSDRILQMLQYVMPYISQGPMVSALAETGMKINWAGISELLTKATGLDQEAQLVIPMTPEEQEAMRQPPPETATDMQKAQMEQETRLKMGEMSLQKTQMQQEFGLQRDRQKQEADLQKQMALSDAEDQREILANFAKEMLEKQRSGAQREQQTAAAQAAVAKNQVEMQKKRVELEIAIRKAQLELQQMQSKLRFQQASQAIRNSPAQRENSEESETE